ncbi:MAG: hypothetical protein AB7K24_13585 [Gemmataceae bacterium]
MSLTAVTIVSGQQYRLLAKLSAHLVQRFTGLSPVVIDAGSEGKSCVQRKLSLPFEYRLPILYFDADWFLTAPWDVSAFANLEGPAAVRNRPTPCVWVNRDIEDLGLDAERYFNTGLLIFGRGSEAACDEALHCPPRSDWGEQTQLNWGIARSGVPLLLLPPQYNVIPLRGAPLPARDEVIGLHIGGGTTLNRIPVLRQARALYRF